MKKKRNKINRELIVDEWFAKAHDDMRSAEVIMQSDEGASSTVCFLSQQMAEKYLKGYLVCMRKEFPKIHHLDKLLTLCEKVDSSFSSLHKEAQMLSEFYVTTRYPGDYPVFGFRDAQKAFAQAVKIKDFVFDKIYGKHKSQ